MVLCQFLQRSTLPLPLVPSPPPSPYSIHRLMNPSNSRPFCFCIYIPPTCPICFRLKPSPPPLAPPDVPIQIHTHPRKHA
jgi:hypothetical protein